MFDWNKDDAVVLSTALAIIIVSAVVLRLILKDKDEKLRRLPLKFLAALIVALEAAKQLEYIIWVPYNTYVLPIHFCSTFIWLMPLAQFTRGKVREFFKPMPFCYSLIVFVLMYVYPHVLLGNATSRLFSDFFASHTLLFHHVMVAYFIFSIALDYHSPRPKDLISVVGGITIYTAYAVPLAYTLKQNYVNILRSTFPPFENIRLKLVAKNVVVGQILYDAMLYTLAVLAAIAIWLIYYAISRLVRKRSSVSSKNAEKTPAD